MSWFLLLVVAGGALFFFYRAHRQARKRFDEILEREQREARRQGRGATPVKGSELKKDI